MQDCIFCRIVKGEVPSVRVHEDEQVLVFADINPITNGHTLIIPKGHYENIWEIPAEVLSAVHRVSRDIAGAMRTALNPAGIALVQLNGRAVNQVVMHYHLHLIPRSENDPELAMTAWDLVPGNMETIRTTAGKIAAALPRRTG